MENVTPGVLQRLRAADIIRVAGLKVASLGQEYCRIGAVQQPQRHSNRLVAFVHVPSALDMPVEPAVSATNHANDPSAGESAESTLHRYTVEVIVESATEWKRICTCNALPDAFCSHAAALLYQWLTHPLSFLAPPVNDANSSSAEQSGVRSLHEETHSPETGTPVNTIPSSVSSNGKLPVQAKGLVPFGGVTETLTQLGLSELRAIAREYEIVTNGLSKAQLVEAIMEMLRQPEVVRRMAATLEKTQRQLLAALALAGGAMLDDDLRGMFERFSLGQPSQLQNVLVVLQGKGLLLRTSFNISSTARIGLGGATLDVGWLVPPEVRNALRVTVPATVFDVQRPDEQGAVPTIQHAELPDLLSLLLLVARKLDGYRLKRDELRDTYAANASAPGTAVRGGASSRPLTTFTSDGSLTLGMPAETLSDATFEWLQQELSYPLPLLRFAVRLLRLTDMLYKDDSGSPNLHVLSNVAPLLLGSGYQEVARDLFELWLTQAPYDELIALQEDGLRLRCRATAMNYPLLRQGELNAENGEARQTVIALLAQCPLQQWLGFSSFARFLYRLNPLFLQNRQRLFSPPHWWVEREEGRPLRPLQLSDWLRAEYFYLARLIRGPLHWWGICDTAEGPDGRLLAFRLTPLAHWFFNAQFPVDEQAHTMAQAPETFLRVQDQNDLLVASSIHAWPLLRVLEDFAEVAGVEYGMLRYRLTPASLSKALGRGLQTTQLLDTLRTYGLEETMLAQYKRWIANFGRVRLYTQVALVETTDTVAMRELAATTSLDAQIVQTLHPTLHILKHTGVERIVDELKRRGQTPLLHH